MLGALADIGAVFSRWRIWYLLGGQDIGLRYRRSILGPFWISFSLAAMILGMGLLYGQIFEQDFGEYLKWLGCSFLAWFLISNMITEGCGAAIESEVALRSARLPIPIFAARIVYRNVIIFLHNLAVVAALLGIFGYQPSTHIFWALPGLTLVVVLGFCLILILAPLSLRFRDIAQVVANLIQISFFLTPIIWLPGQGRVSTTFVQANPFYHLLELIRAPILGSPPTALNWSVALGVLAAAGLGALASTSVSRRRIYLWL